MQNANRDVGPKVEGNFFRGAVTAIVFGIFFYSLIGVILWLLL